MTAEIKPLRFGHHTLAVLAATMLGSTVFSLIWTVGLAIDAYDRLPGLAWLATMAGLFWLGVFIVALPGAGIVLSLLFPITRRRTVAANAICIIAGIASGVFIAPIANAKLHDASIFQLCTFALIGATIAGCYLVIGHRLSQNASAAVHPFERIA